MNSSFNFSSSGSITLNLGHFDTIPVLRNRLPLLENKSLGNRLLYSNISMPPLYQSAHSLSPQSTIDMRSPRPTISFSPCDQPMTLAKKKLSMTLAELVQSEYSYLASLKQLRDAFFDNCVDSVEPSYSLKIVKYCLLHLIEIHSLLIEDLTKLFPSDRNLYQIAELFAQTVCKSAISKFWYEEYIKQYEGFIKIAKSSNNSVSDDKEISIKWATAWQKYLEKAQSSKKHLDYSIESLSQGPTSRISKYKLLIQSIHKHCQENIETSEQIKKCLDKIHVQLVQINDGSWNLHEQQCKFNEQVESIVNFNDIPFEHELSIEFFGNPLLIGSITIIWIVDNEKGKIATYPTILFKSHLIICDNVKSRRYPYKHNIKFVIPLSKCQLVTDLKNYGGIFCKYPYVLKLLFEDYDCQYEFGLIFLTELEFSIWGNLLDTLVNHVNGPCTMNFKQDQIKYVCKFPQEICCFDVDLESQNFEKNCKRCYFKHSINLVIMFDFSSTDLHSTSSVLINYLENNDDTTSHPVLTIKKSSVVANQTNFEKVWTKELPLHFIKEKAVKTTFTEVIRCRSLKSIGSLKRKNSSRAHYDENPPSENCKEEPKEGKLDSHEDIPQAMTSRSNSLQTFKDTVTSWMNSTKTKQRELQ
ncbi:hypothetical protein JA1_002531 [Spathaspora sp. JA1]|nr:hypothetical protein JA1_002531 [Spathaspora sp. JA1]